MELVRGAGVRRRARGGSRALRVLRRLWVAAGLGVTVWLWLSFQARGVDGSVMQDGHAVRVAQTAETLSFVPVARQGAGLIFLPGAMVEPVAYAPMARALAERGFPVVIVKLPLRVAPTAAQQQVVVDRIAAAAAEHGLTDWALGGHSRGAALAAQFAADPGLGVRRLILVGTSHPRAAERSLATTALAVTKVYATEDGLASPDEVLANGVYLPPTTTWVRVDGGNHAQFGFYGRQLGDGRATISRAEQQRQLVDAIAAALAR